MDTLSLVLLIIFVFIAGLLVGVGGLIMLAVALARRATTTPPPVTFKKV